MYFVRRIFILLGSTLGPIISLEGRPRTLRVGCKQTFAMVVGTYLWTGRERVLEIYRPSTDSGTVHIKRIEIPANFGSLTCMTSLGGRAQTPSVLFQSSYPSPFADPDMFVCNEEPWHIYTGHLDGKVVEWDGRSFARQRVFDMGAYRISALCGVGDNHLWIGFGTGKIVVLDCMASTSHPIFSPATSNTPSGTSSVMLSVGKPDGGHATTTSPWSSQVTLTSSTNPALHAVTALKEWLAESGEAIEDLILDPDCLVHCGHILVASFTKSGRIQIWNGLFPRDFIGTISYICHYKR